MLVGGLYGSGGTGDGRGFTEPCAVRDWLCVKRGGSDDFTGDCVGRGCA
jgi:hypothetical protein